MAAQGSFRSPQDRRPRNSLEEARVLTAQFELKHLRYAVAATRYRSFRKAADALGIKQSTLSRGIAQLEARLGVILFERTSGGVLLTRAGRKILRTSTHLVETLDQMISTARNIGNGDAGHITVGFYTSLSAGNLRASLVEYAARFPKVDIQTHGPDIEAGGIAGRRFAHVTAPAQDLAKRIGVVALMDERADLRLLGLAGQFYDRGGDGDADEDDGAEPGEHLAVHGDPPVQLLPGNIRALPGW